MKTAIDQVRTMLDTLPPDATLEDVQYHIYIMQKIEQGLKDVEEGKVIPHEQVVAEMQSWFKK